MKNCKEIPLSELITQHTTVEKISDMKNEHYITLSSNGKGAHERLIKDGKYPVPFSGYRVSEGQFIYSRIDARNGAYDIIPPELDGFVVSKDFPVFDIDTSKVLPRFLLRSVLSNGFIEQVKHSSFGATNRMRIKEDALGSYLIRIPTLDVQNNIVECLDKAQSIIKYRRNEIARYDELVKARFVEMFGDPSDNSRTDRVQLSEICEKITDGEHGSVTRVPSGHPFLNAKHVLKNGRIDWETITYVSDEDHQRIYKRCNPVEGDILLTTTGTIGNVAIMPKFEEVSMDRGITLLKIDRKKVTSEFVAELLKQPSIQTEMGVNVHASAIGHLFMNKVKKLPAILPSIERQAEFTDFVRQVDKSKSVVQKSLDETQLLFDNLMQQYFG